MNLRRAAPVIAFGFLAFLGCDAASSPASAPAPALPAWVSVAPDGVAVAAFRFHEKTPCAACVRAVNKAGAALGEAFLGHDLAPGEPAFRVRFDPRRLDAARLAAALAAAEPAIRPQS
jgi:hypothetical protein